MAEMQPVTVDAFLGLNESVTETFLRLGEASYMSNWMITIDKKLQKQYGYEHINDDGDGNPIRGIWYGELHGEPHLLYARDGHVYEHNLDTHVDADLGTITDAYPTTFFVTNNTVYIMDGTELYSWKPGDTLKVVEGYIPTVLTGALPTGGGTLLESINYISGTKTAKYSGNGIAAVFQLPEQQIDSVDIVILNAVALKPGVDYTVDLGKGTVSFTNPPPDGTNNITITWTKNDPANRALITKNRYYGGMYYARHWIFGNPDRANTRFCSGVTMTGVSDPTYWPMWADSDVGEYAITDIKTQYDKQIIFTTGDSSGASAWYSTSESYTDPNSGIVTTVFPVSPINAKVGNVAPGQVQIILNNPYTIWKGVYVWESTYVINEKNARWISQRVQRSLDEVDLRQAITWDWDDQGLYLLCVGKRIWVYNYRVDAWYRLDIPHEPTCFMTVDRKLCFGTKDGYIMRFDENLGTFDGQEIVATWDMGYHNFGVDYLRKFVPFMYISLLPLLSTHVDIYLSTDRDATFRFVKTVYYGLSNFDTWDFSGIDVPGYETKGFSFEVNFSPQPKHVKLKAKKIDYIKLRLECGGTDGAVVLSITLPTRIGGLIKNK